MKTLATNTLFTPIQVGLMELKHRVVMGPLTRSRSVQPGNIPGDLMLEYYSQRASDGGLIVSEATSISVAGGGWFAAPGLYSDEQVAGWKKITDAVHQKRGYMFSQLWIQGVPGMWTRRTAQPLSVLQSTWNIGRIRRYWSLRPMVGVSLRLTARSTSQKFRALSKIIAKRPSTPKPLDSMALSFTRVTATCLINFCRMASTGELICMAVRSKIGLASFFK